MNNKPVAWMELYYGEPNNISLTDAELRDSGEVYKTVPLYTNPPKDLTDEEILNEWILTSYNPKTYVWADDTDDDLVLQFARAILRKAQEK